MKISLWKKIKFQFFLNYNKAKFKRMIELIKYFEKKGLIQSNILKGEIKGYTIDSRIPQSLNIFTEINDKKLKELIEYYSNNKLPINTFYLIEDKDNKKNKQIECSQTYH